VDRARSQPGRQGEAGGAVADQQRQVLVLLVVAVIAAQGLAPVRGVVGGVQVQDDLGRRRGPGANEQVHQIVVEDLEPLRLGGAALQQDFGLAGFDGLSAGVGVREACQGRAAGQRRFAVGRQVGQDLKEGVVAQVLGVVAIRVAGEDLIDLLGE
jgi:hypothetical protein